MRERQILFGERMVRAILVGRKTQTRREVKPQPHDGCGNISVGNYAPVAVDRHGEEYPGPEIFGAYDDSGEWGTRCPYGQPGDRLYVRETWAQPTALDPGPTFYRADYPACVPSEFENVPTVDQITWKPSIHMPRALSRILLEVTAIRAERLNDISDEDALAEGIYPTNTGLYPGAARAEFMKLWESINGLGSWAANPWVWVVEFKVLP